MPDRLQVFFINMPDIMEVSLTIIRYPKIFIPFAFFAMALHRLPLWLNKNISFYKLMGCGRNGTFDKIPDLQQWAILSVMNSNLNKENQEHTTTINKETIKKIYGSFISGWYSFFSCETFTILLEPVEGHGSWDGKKAFGNLPAKSNYEGPVGILTRASIRLNKLKYFWEHIAPVAQLMNNAKGFITSVGIGEMPWIRQATFSIWQTKEAMLAFAYGTKEHKEVIRKTHDQNWYSEQMFIRFRIIGSSGTIRGINPLQGKM